MPKSRSSLSVSVRRHFVDNFFFSHAGEFTGEKAILDIGGKKKSKRGLFDIGKFAQNVKYVNIDKTTEPDILSDAASLPLPDASFNIVILGETLEHVPEPLLVLKEAWRILQPGGTIYASVPFIYPIHADPFDFGRYTDYYWKEISRKAGFNDILIERHGGMFAVLALMVQHFFRSKNISWHLLQEPLVSLLMIIDRKTVSPLLLSWTTGYGLIFKK